MHDLLKRNLSYNLVNRRQKFFNLQLKQNDEGLQKSLGANGKQEVALQVLSCSVVCVSVLYIHKIEEKRILESFHSENMAHLLLETSVMKILEKN